MLAFWERKNDPNTYLSHFALKRQLKFKKKEREKLTAQTPKRLTKKFPLNLFANICRKESQTY